MKTLSAIAFAMAMAASPLAMAQTTTSPSTPSTPPAKTTTPPASTTTPSASTNTDSSSKQTQWYSHQAGEMRASKLIGSTVRNTAGDNIGDVNEVILSKDGKVAGVVLGVGGFLGMGEHEVAVSFDSLKMTRDNNNKEVITLNATKDSLKAAPQWKWQNASNSGTSGTSTTKPSK